MTMADNTLMYIYLYSLFGGITMGLFFVGIGYVINLNLLVMSFSGGIVGGFFGPVVYMRLAYNGKKA